MILYNFQWDDIMDYGEFLEDYTSNWLRHAQVGDQVYCRKEHKYATIHEKFTFKDGGLLDSLGDVKLKFDNGDIQTWILRPDGTGIDRSECLRNMEPLMRVNKTHQFKVIDRSVPCPLIHTDGFIIDCESYQGHPGECYYVDDGLEFTFSGKPRDEVVSHVRECLPYQGIARKAIAEDLRKQAIDIIQEEAWKRYGDGGPVSSAWKHQKEIDLKDGYASESYHEDGGLEFNFDGKYF